MSSFSKILSKIPDIPLSNLVMINDHEFVTASDSNIYYSVHKHVAHDKHGLYKYNTITNEWTLLIAYPQNCSISEHRICYDSTNNIVYLYGGSNNFCAFNLNTMKMEIIEGLTDVGSNPILLMINNKCHIILGSNSKCHYVYKPELKELDKIFTFDHLELGLCEHEVVHIQSKNKLLLFGGYDDMDGSEFDEIWECDVSEPDSECKWTKLKDLTLPIKMSNFSCVLSKNEDYLVIFGAGDLVQNFFILDLNEMKFYTSKIKPDDTGNPHAVLMYDEKSDDLIVAGFIRMVSKENDMNIPLGLMQVFHMFFDSEMLYLLYRSFNTKDRLYEIELNDILDEKIDASLTHF